MRIGCLQFAPQLGDVDNNLNRADAALSRQDVEDLDLLVLPELAFSGYNFKSLQDISPFLEPSGSGITSLWTRTTALKYDCTVITGYPEKVDPSIKWPTGPEYYNAAIVVNGDGETIANYRKNHLYSTDKKWALESSSGFSSDFLPGLGPTCIGIGTDLNPYSLGIPSHKFEFAHHILDSDTRLVVIPMASITQEDARSFSRRPQEPDMASLSQWISRLEPIIRAESDEEVIIVFANRTGTEDEITYAGTSAIIGIKSGEVHLYGVLGRGDKELLVVDTNAPPYAKLQQQVNSNASGSQTGSDLHSQSLKELESSRKPMANLKSSTGSTTASRPSGLPISSTSSYRRNDLYIAVPVESTGGAYSKTPSVHTPTAPSPTPHSMRPRLPIPPVSSMTQRYLDSHTSSFPLDALTGRTPGYILGGEVRFDASCPPSATSTTYASESHFSESSMESPQAYWTPHPYNTATSTLPRIAPGSPNESSSLQQNVESETADRTEVEERHSIRSDVSVWNNYQGRPRSIVPVPNSYTHASLDANSIMDTTEKPKTAKDYSLPKRPSSPKSRHASRSRGTERSNSVVGMDSGIVSIEQKLEDVALRAESAQESYLRRQTPGDEACFSQRHEPLGRSKDQPICVRTETSIPARAVSRMSIPIAMDSSLWNSSAGHNEASRTTASGRVSELPLLKAFSREQIQSMGHAGHSPFMEDPEVGNDGTNRCCGQQHIHLCEESGNTRGRQRHLSEATPNMPSRLSDYPAIPMLDNNQHESVNLSRFTLIEEYPSPHCPVHGQRSRSGAQHEHVSRVARLEKRRQSASPSVRTLSYNRSSSGPLRTQFHEQASSETVYNDEKPSLSPMQNNAPKTAASSSTSEGLPTFSGNRQLEPKTPKAMKITEGTHTEEVAENMHDLPPLGQNTRSEAAPIPRPRSCGW